MKKLIILFLSLIWLNSLSCKAQEEPLTIVTHHPDFVVKVKRCVASGTTLILDLTATNTGVNDVNGFSIAPGLTGVIDDEGNTYRRGIGAKVANQANYTYQRNAFTDVAMETKLLPNIPVKVSLMVPNFSSESSSIALIEIGVVCTNWNYPYRNRGSNQRLIIRNIPITRR